MGRLKDTLKLGLIKEEKQRYGKTQHTQVDGKRDKDKKVDIVGLQSGIYRRFGNWKGLEWQIVGLEHIIPGLRFPTLICG